MPVNVPPVQYLRNERHLIDVSITGMKLDDGRVAFGFAYRSPKDPPDKAVGGYLAIKRAVGMVQAAQNGVTRVLSRIDATPHNTVVLKSFLGSEDRLIQLLETTPQLHQQTLPKRVEKILAGMNKNERTIEVAGWFNGKADEEKRKK